MRTGIARCDERCRAAEPPASDERARRDGGAHGVLVEVAVGVAGAARQRVDGAAVAGTAAYKVGLTTLEVDRLTRWPMKLTFYNTHSSSANLGQQTRGHPHRSAHVESTLCGEPCDLTRTCAAQGASPTSYRTRSPAMRSRAPRGVPCCGCCGLLCVVSGGSTRGV